MATDAAGNIYVSDPNNYRIQKFKSDGTYLLKWGASGTGPGQFGKPIGVATDASGNIYVSDEQLNRIQKFTSTGTYITQWGSTGSGEGQFNHPYGVATDAAGDVYVIEGYYNNRIQKFTSTGTFIEMWGWGVATGAAAYERCTSGCQGGLQGSGAGQFNFGFTMATDAAGGVYVVDQHRIQKFASDGTYITQWGSFGGGDGQLAYAAGVATDAAGNVYVADQRNQRVQKFTGTGTFIEMWGWGVATGTVAYEGCTSGCQEGIAGSGCGQFFYPSGVAADADGNIYVLEFGNSRIQKFGVRPLTVSGEDTVCAASTGNTYSVEGQPVGTIYSWTITGNGSIVGPTDGPSVTVNAGSAGTFTLAVSLDAGCRLAEKVITVGNCVLNCPRTAGFWKQQCAQKAGGSTKFGVLQVTQITECVDDRVSIFDWAPTTDFASFCATIDPPTPMDQRKQARRQFATFLANICTGQLGLIANNGDQIFLDLSTPINCAGLTSATIGDVIGEVDGRLVSLEGQPLADPTVKDEYSNLIACLDGINNGIGIGTVCPAAEPVQGGGIGLAPGAAGRIFAVFPAPNPFTQTTYFVLAVGGTQSKAVDVRVFDVAGRLVRTIVTGTLPPGRHEMVWDGYSEQGRRVPTGVYFLHSAVGGDKAVIRLVYMR